MGSSALMSLGLKGMTANYAALQVTGNNIANANVDGYSRQSVQLTTSQGQYTGAGFFGKGVDVTSVTRAHDEFLTREAAGTKALAAMDSARLEQLQRLEGVFKTGEQGLGYAADQLLNAMTDLSSNPADASSRQVVLARAGDLATQLQDADSALVSLQAGVTADLRAAVAQVNTLAKGIAEVNQRIAAARGLGQPPNDLLDERERLISNLSEHLQVTRIEAADGSLAVFVGGGQRLVLGGSASTLTVFSDPEDSSRMTLGLKDGSSQRMVGEDTLGGGGIAGLLRFQNEDLVDARNQIGQFAAAVGGAVNTQQQRGVTLMSPLGSVAGSAMFTVGSPQALPNATNARNAAGAPIGEVSLTVVDAGALKASDYDLAADPSNAGQWLLTRRSDGLQRSIASGDTVDGMRIDVGPGVPQAGDRFLLQPVARAASGFALALSDPRGIAAASPLMATVEATNIGTARVAALSVATAPLPVPGATAHITFTDDQGSYAWSLYDANNNVLSSGNGSWQAGGTIPASATDINGFTLQLAGVPRNGDIIEVAPTPAKAIASNNGNALALLALREGAVVDGKSPSDAYAESLANIGVRVQGSRSSSEISTAVATQAEQQRSSESGVSLDEEAARLIQYQQSYQAAAKMLQVAQSMFDTLLQTAGR